MITRPKNERNLFTVERDLSRLFWLWTVRIQMKLFRGWVSFIRTIQNRNRRLQFTAVNNFSRGSSYPLKSFSQFKKIWWNKKSYYFSEKRLFVSLGPVHFGTLDPNFFFCIQFLINFSSHSFISSLSPFITLKKLPQNLKRTWSITFTVYIWNIMASVRLFIEQDQNKKQRVDFIENFNLLACWGFSPHGWSPSTDSRFGSFLSLFLIITPHPSSSPHNMASTNCLGATRP